MQALVFRHCFALSFSFIAAYISIPYLIRAAGKMGFMDTPDGKIKVHEIPIPHLGGVAIFGSFIASIALSYPFQNVILWLLLGCTLLLLIGLIDDLRVLSPLRKFLGQVIAVLCFLKGGFALKSTFFSSQINLFLSAFWMLGVINAFNLIDVMDGLSSVVALVCAGTFFLIALLFKQYAVTLLLLTFIGAVSAFLFHNKPPARIYLGDAGSMFVGGFLSAVPMLFNWSTYSFDAYYAPVIILAIPLIEVSSLMVIRTWKGIPFYQGSPHHFSLYLLNKGWSKRNVLWFTIAMGSYLSGSALLFLGKVIAEQGLLLAGLLFSVIWYYVVFSAAGVMMRGSVATSMHEKQPDKIKQAEL